MIEAAVKGRNARNRARRYRAILYREEVSEAGIITLTPLTCRQKLTVQEAATALRVSNKSVYRYIEEGLLAAHKYGDGTIRIDAAALAAFEEGSRV